MTNAGEHRIGMLLANTWRIERVLGVGGMGCVYAASHVRNGLPVAVKVLHRPLVDDTLQRARFAREGYVANQIEHPGVVRVLDDGIDGEDVFMVMELLRGCTLKQRWSEQQKRLGEAEVAAMIEAVLEMLCAAHRAQVVHRDIKPDNIFIAHDGRYRLMDFGIAKLWHAADAPRTATGDILGTPAFMAPEQAAGRWSEVDATSDLYALAATAWTMLSGRLVHQSTSIGTLLVATATTPAPPIRSAVPWLSAARAAVLDRALSFERRDRWPNAESMRHAWLATESRRPSEMTTPRHFANPSLSNSDSFAPDSHLTEPRLPTESGQPTFNNQRTERMLRPELLPRSAPLPPRPASPTTVMVAAADYEPIPPTLPMARMAAKSWSPWLWIGITLGLTAFAIVSAVALWSLLA